MALPLPLPLTFLVLLVSPFLFSPATPTPTQPQPQTQTETETPIPAAWPEQFHSILFINYSNDLSLVDLWYDWPGGRNFNIIKHQCGGARLFDLEWDNGTSFYYTLEEPRSCRTAHFDVGVLRPNWLDGAEYLGRDRVDGFVCDVWTKADFITYYQDVDTKRPVKWIFYTGRTVHVMTYEVGAVLEDAAWQAPVYCFQKNDTATEQQEIKNPEMFLFDNAHSINRNRIRQKTLAVRISSAS